MNLRDLRLFPLRRLRSGRSHSDPGLAVEVWRKEMEITRWSG